MSLINVMLGSSIITTKFVKLMDQTYELLTMWSESHFSKSKKKKKKQSKYCVCILYTIVLKNQLNNGLNFEKKRSSLKFELLKNIWTFGMEKKNVSLFPEEKQ